MNLCDASGVHAVAKGATSYHVQPAARPRASEQNRLLGAGSRALAGLCILEKLESKSLFYEYFRRREGARARAHSREPPLHFTCTMGAALSSCLVGGQRALMGGRILEKLESNLFDFFIIFAAYLARGRGRVVTNENRPFTSRERWRARSAAD